MTVFTFSRLHGIGGSNGGLLPLDPYFFNFMKFLAKMIKMMAPPRLGLAPPVWEILDPPLHGIISMYLNYPMP